MFNIPTKILQKLLLAADASVETVKYTDAAVAISFNPATNVYTAVRQDANGVSAALAESSEDEEYPSLFESDPDLESLVTPPIPPEDRTDEMFSQGVFALFNAEEEPTGTETLEADSPLLARIVSKTNSEMISFYPGDRNYGVKCHDTIYTFATPPWADRLPTWSDIAEDEEAPVIFGTNYAFRAGLSFTGKKDSGLDLMCLTGYEGKKWVYATDGENISAAKINGDMPVEEGGSVFLPLATAGLFSKAADDDILSVSWNASDMVITFSGDLGKMGCSVKTQIHSCHEPAGFLPLNIGDDALDESIEFSLPGLLIGAIAKEMLAVADHVPPGESKEDKESSYISLHLTKHDKYCRLTVPGWNFGRGAARLFYETEPDWESVPEWMFDNGICHIRIPAKIFATATAYADSDTFCVFRVRGPSEHIDISIGDLLFKILPQSM